MMPREALDDLFTFCFSTNVTKSAQAMRDGLDDRALKHVYEPCLCLYRLERCDAAEIRGWARRDVRSTKLSIAINEDMSNSPRAHIAYAYFGDT